MPTARACWWKARRARDLGSAAGAGMQIQPAAAWHLPTTCMRFFALRAKNRILTERKYRSAKGKNADRVTRVRQKTSDNKALRKAMQSTNPARPNADEY